MTRLPVLFVSHGSPMLALEGPAHPYVRDLAAFARTLPDRPRAVLVLSAHWQTSDLRVTAAPRPGTLHDFYGFPPELHAIDYPAPGDPGLAREVATLTGAALDADRPLDHGAWAVLRHLFPAADVPVVQLSLPRRDPAGLVALGAALRPLRDAGILIVASGGLVHNLRLADFAAPDGQVDPWAREAETWFVTRLEEGRTEDLLAHRDRWPRSAWAAPTTEHLDVLFPALGAATPGAAPRSVHEGWQLANMSLRCLAWA